MSLYDYKISQEIAGQDYPFYALIMTAMRQADSDNIDLLKFAFPEVWRELKARYNAPGGVLETETRMDTERGGDYEQEGIKSSLAKKP